MRPVPEKLALRVRVELLLAGKTIRSFAREVGIPNQTVCNVLHGHRGWAKADPSKAWRRVMTAALPWLPADVARDVQRVLASAQRREGRR